MVIEWILLLSAQSLFGVKTLSVCDLSAAACDYNGKQVRLVAEYVTDRRHGGYFIDKKCPRVRVTQGGAVEGPKDPSVATFDDAVGEGALAHELAKFEVDITGRYDSSDKGSLIIEKVWSYRRVP